MCRRPLDGTLGEGERSCGSSCVAGRCCRPACRAQRRVCRQAMSRTGLLRAQAVGQRPCGFLQRGSLLACRVRPALLALGRRSHTRFRRRAPHADCLGGLGSHRRAPSQRPPARSRPGARGAARPPRRPSAPPRPGLAAGRLAHPRSPPAQSPACGKVSSSAAARRAAGRRHLRHLTLAWPGARSRGGRAAAHRAARPHGARAGRGRAPGLECDVLAHAAHGRRRRARRRRRLAAGGGVGRRGAAGRCAPRRRAGASGRACDALEAACDQFADGLAGTRQGLLEQVAILDGGSEPKVNSLAWAGWARARWASSCAVLCRPAADTWCRATRVP